MRTKTIFCLALLAIIYIIASAAARAQETTTSNGDDEALTLRQKQAAKQATLGLADRDPLIRQRAAEELARLADPDQMKLIAGYRAEEKNARVRLALDWALYRLGKRESLFNIVRDLDSSRRNQSESYLSQLDSPTPLYIFLEHVNGKTQIRLLEAFAHIGDAETIERLKAYTSSDDPQIAEAARFATREINARLSQTPADASSARPRQVGVEKATTP
jgi:HEAT repeat protein